YNNAVLDRELNPAERREAIAAMRDAYSAAGVDRYAAWVHEDDRPLRRELREMGYVVTESTRAMGLSIEDFESPPAEIDLKRLGWDEYLHFLTSGEDLPEGLLGGVDPDAFVALGAWAEGEILAAAIAFDHDGDCGIFNMGTLERARRRGIAGALTAHHLCEARARGCRTATLQATPMAEGVYAAFGFRDLGRFVEYAPGEAAGRQAP